VRRDGRRWLICLGDLLLADSELMRWIAAVAPAVEVSVEGSSSSEVGGGLPEPPVATDPEDLHGLKAGADDGVGQSHEAPEGDLEDGSAPRSSDREEPADDGVDPVGQSLSAYQKYQAASPTGRSLACHDGQCPDRGVREPRGMEEEGA
jgi:hypothetical protein